MTKLKLLFFTMLTALCFFIPTGFCANYVEYLSSFNRVINTRVSMSTYGQIVVDLDSTQSSFSYYVTLQVFDKSALDVPIDLGTTGSSGNLIITYLYNGGSTTLNTKLNTNNNYGFRTGALLGSNYTPTKLIIENRNLLNLTSANSFWENMVINVVLTRSTSAFCGYFIPNSYYNVADSQDKGVFNNWSCLLWLQSQQNPTDRTETMLTYNQIAFNELSSVVASNNDTGGYQYYLRITCNNALVKYLPNIHFSFLELESIMINNVVYSYSSALNTFSYLFNNIVIYDDDSTLFVESVNRTSSNDIIQYMQFRIADYTFKSSSYYQSNIGILGYIQNTRITTNGVDLLALQKGYYETGYQNGVSDGYRDGYATAQAENTNSFDQLFFSIGSVPMQIISSVLNFEILGVNLLSFFMAIITLMLFIFITRKFKE